MVTWLLNTDDYRHPWAQRLPATGSGVAARSWWGGGSLRPAQADERSSLKLQGPRVIQPQGGLCVGSFSWRRFIDAVPAARDHLAAFPLAGTPRLAHETGIEHSGAGRCTGFPTSFSTATRASTYSACSTSIGTPPPASPPAWATRSGRRPGLHAQTRPPRGQLCGRRLSLQAAIKRAPSSVMRHRKPSRVVLTCKWPGQGYNSGQIGAG